MAGDVWGDVWGRIFIPVNEALVPFTFFAQFVHPAPAARRRKSFIRQSSFVNRQSFVGPLSESEFFRKRPHCRHS